MIKNEIKKCLFSLFVGLSVGVIEVIFGKMLILITSIRESYFFPLILFLPFGGLAIVALYSLIGGRSKEGMGLIFKVGHGEEEKVPIVLIPLVMVSTWITHLFGGSAGREGVAVQIGGAFSNWLARGKLFLGFDQVEWRKTSMIIGMAAGFAGLFQTPLAATFFVLEVLVIGKLEMKSILYTGLAAYSAYFVSSGLGLEKASFHIESTLTLSPLLLIELLLLGLLFALVGVSFSVGLRKGKELFSRLLPNGYQRIFIGGVVLALAIFMCHEGRYAGLGTNLITASFTGESIYSYDFLLKMLLTILTLSIGFQGGEVTPLFAIGCSFGVVVAPLFGLPSTLVAALGYVAVFGSGTNTFFAPILIGGEIFGFEWLPFFFVTMLSAYYFNFNYSIYGNQKNIEELL